MELKVIARAKTPFKEKFGVPRQSGLVSEAKGEIIFEQEYRNEAAVRGLDEFSHIWLIWGFDRAVREKWSPTVRPPRLGGNTRLGVFATRSPFRPNPIGLSSVHLDGIRMDRVLGPVLLVSGIDMVDGTPIYDIKPFIRYCDNHTDASDGFTEHLDSQLLDVHFPDELSQLIPEIHRTGLIGVLSQDPRPRYQSDSDRIYGLSYYGKNISFKVDGHDLFVTEVTDS